MSVLVLAHMITVSLMLRMINEWDLMIASVPIYDATAGNFVLSEDINDVAGLPLYKQGKTDLPDGSCVTVGHTIGMYKNKEGQSTLTLNIHWVIVWGCPS